MLKWNCQAVRVLAVYGTACNLSPQAVVVTLVSNILLADVLSGGVDSLT